MPEGTGQGSDLLWQASIDDKTLEFFQRFDANVARLADTTESGFQRVDKRIDQSGTTIGAVAGLVSGLTAKFVDLGLRAASALKGFLTESANLRARVDVLGTVLEKIGTQSGYSQEEIKQFEEEVKSMGITTQATREALVRMTRANIDWAEASKLARIAQDAAVVAGINSSQAFERLILGIQKMEPELLDELGITLRRSDAYKRYAEQLGVSEKALSDVQKQEAILQEIYRQSSAVAGTYEASMGNVGKQMTSLPRYIEEIQLALGGIFQPAMSAQVEFYTEKLKEVLKWLQENEEELTVMGDKLGMVMAKSLELFESLLSMLTQLPEGIKNAGLELARVLSLFDDGLSNEELQSRASELQTYFAQAITIVATSVAAGVALVRESIRIAIDDVQLLWATLTGGDVQGALDSLNEDAAMFGERVRNSAREAMTWVGELTGAIEKTNEAVEEPATPQAMEAIQEEAPKTTDALDEVNKALEDLHERMQEDAARRAREAFRKQVEDQLRLSWQIEDIERGHQERISQIMEQFQEQRQENTEDYNDALADLQQRHSRDTIRREQDFRQRLEDIEQNYNDDMKDLAVARDAIGLLRRMREHDKELREANETQEEQRQQAEQSYQEQLDALRQSLTEQETELEESLRKQLEQAEEARQKEYEALERNLARQREIQALHDKWAEEDRQIAYQKELEQLAERFAGMEGLTAEGLNGVLSHWEQYLGDLSVIRDEYMALTAEMAAATAQMANASAAMNMYRGGLFGRAGISGMPGVRYGGGRPANTTSMGGPTGSNLFPGSGGGNQVQAGMDVFNQYYNYINNTGGGVGDSSNSFTDWLENLSGNLTGWLNNAAEGLEDWMSNPWMDMSGAFNIGQAGQISMGLAQPQMQPFIPNGILPSIPSVPPVPGGVDRREIVVKVESEHLEPYLQRKLVNTLIEVERNRGS